MWSRSNPQCDELLPLCQEPEVQERGSCPWCVPGMAAAGEGAWGAWWCRGVSAGHPEHRPLEGKGFSCCEQRLCLQELLATGTAECLFWLRSSRSVPQWGLSGGTK